MSNETQTQDAGNDQERNWKRMREELATKDETIAKLTSKVRASAFREAGFDPGSGNGKALDRIYDGELEADAIREFAAKEFGWKPGQADAGASPQGQQPDVVAAIHQGQERLDQVQNLSGPATPPDVNQQEQERIKQLQATPSLLGVTEEELSLTLNPLRREMGIPTP